MPARAPRSASSARPFTSRGRSAARPARTVAAPRPPVSAETVPCEPTPPGQRRVPPALPRARRSSLASLLLLEMAFQAAVPLSFKFLLDRGVLARDFGFLVMTLAGLGIATVVVMAGGVARDHLYAHLGSRVLGDIRARMFRRLQMLSMSFYARAQTGDVLSRFSADLGAVEGAMAARHLPGESCPRSTSWPARSCSSSSTGGWPSPPC